MKEKLLQGKTEELCADFDYDSDNKEIIISLFEGYHYQDEIHLSESEFQDLINNYRSVVCKG